MTEWRFIPGFGEDYFISDEGVLKSNKRVTNSVPGRALKQRTDTKGRKSVVLWRNGVRYTVRVHRLVALAFLGSPPAGKDLVRHLDGDPTNNKVDNLAWGDQKDNVADARSHGTLWNLQKSSCPQGHPYDEENIYRRPGNPAHRQCRTCIAARNEKARKPRLKQPIVHGTTTGYNRGCRCDDCVLEMRAYWIARKHLNGRNS